VKAAPVVAPVAEAPAPLTDEELVEFNDLQNRFTADPAALDATEVQRYGELADRYAATAQQ
jgi:hypothetical protein